MKNKLVQSISHVVSNIKSACYRTNGSVLPWWILHDTDFPSNTHKAEVIPGTTSTETNMIYKLVLDYCSGVTCDHPYSPNEQHDDMNDEESTSDTRGITGDIFTIFRQLTQSDYHMGCSTGISKLSNCLLYKSFVLETLTWINFSTTRLVHC